MKKRMKRAGTVLSLLLVISLLVGVFTPIPALAAQSPASESLPDAEVPAITAQPQGAAAGPGESCTLSVEAGVGDGGTLTYQWFSSGVDANTGGTAVPGATGASFAAPAPDAGTVYYYVEITNTGSAGAAGQSALAVSEAAPVTAAPAPDSAVQDEEPPPESEAAPELEPVEDASLGTPSAQAGIGPLYVHEEHDVGILRYKETGEHTVAVVGLSAAGAAETAVTIPETVLIGSVTFEVTAILYAAFYGNTTLTQVEIPAGVVQIDRYAFGECTQLAGVVFAAGSQLETIGEFAFEKTALTALTVPASVGSIGNSAFANTSLGSLTFEAGARLEAIGDAAFSGAPIPSLEIPASVRTIGASTFGGNTQLSTLAFAAGSRLESIGTWAFCSLSAPNTALTAVTLPASLKTVGLRAFQNNTALASVTFEAGSALELIEKLYSQGAVVYYRA